MFYYLGIKINHNDVLRLILRINVKFLILDINKKNIYINKMDYNFFQSLYESIKTEPFKIPEDDGNDLMHTFFNPDKEGWLWKQGNVENLNKI